MPGVKRRSRLLEVLQPEDGGVAQHVLDLALGLHGRGWPVEVAAAPANVVLPALRRAGVPVHELPLRRAPGSARRRAQRGGCGGWWSDGGFALVHAHSSKAGALARLALPRRVRLVYTPHCFGHLADFAAAQRALYRLVEQALVVRADAIVAVSEWERRRARETLWGASSRLELVRNGVGACPAAEPHPELREFAAGAPLAGMLAVLRPQKDPLAAVRAAARLDGAGRLAIVGNGELRDATVAEIERLGLEGVVRWFPFEGEPGPYLAAFDLLLMPSRWESLPIGALEAQACGVPVLGTDVGGMSEAVTGRLVGAGDPAALASALAEALGDPAWRRDAGEAGRRMVRERFSLEAMLDRIEELYERLLA